jgi:hypothetical protein
VSAARGSWVDRDAQAAGLAISPNHGSNQSLLGIDAEVARGHWIARGEWWHVRFAVPTLANPLVATATFVEARYRFRPRWQFSARGDRLAFSEITNAAGVTNPWDAPVWRVEGALGFRVNRRLDLRAGWQHNWRITSRTRTRGFPTVQALFWF